ncbi:MAG: FHA domain-containing protein [Acidobacteriota bacterium]
MYAMANRLVHRRGSLEGGTSALEADLIRVGRDHGNDVVWPDNVVSAHHAEIRRQRGRHVLVDLDSRNGTFVNGERVRERVLEDGDRIELGEGGPMMEVHLDPPVSGTLIVPLSGAWEPGNEPIPVTRGLITMGRGRENDIVVGRADGSPVSTRHVRIRLEAGNFELVDLQSRSGTYVNGSRVRTANLRDGDRVQLGVGGPFFEIRFGRASQIHEKDHPIETDEIIRRIEAAARGGPAGDRTMMLLDVAQRYYRRRRWPFVALSIMVLAVSVAISFELYRKHKQVLQLRQMAEVVFHQIRLIEAELVARRVSMPEEQFESLRNKKEKLEQDYDRYLESLGIYEHRTPVEQALMKLARKLGETDMDVPAGFQPAVLDYVEKWRRTARLRTALNRARSKDLPKKIRLALDRFGLPREFLFIALQESDFDSRRVGPPTRLGIAKGMWQFVPSTAADYGLRLGPLKDVGQYDPQDQRHDENRSTQAAAHYLAYLYSTKAAASGLLVIAAYNYGETRIIDRLDRLPNDPGQRSFWNFYRKGWIPPETRDYVMYILSATLICEDPRLFDFPIEPISSRW